MLHHKKRRFSEKLNWTLENKNVFLTQLGILLRTKTGSYKHTVTTSAAQWAKCPEALRFCQHTDHHKPFPDNEKTNTAYVYIKEKGQKRRGDLKRIS